MKIITLFFLFLTFVATTFAQTYEVPNRPSPQRLVNILSLKPFLSQQEINQLEQKLDRFSDSTSNQIAVVVVDDLNGLTANDYATQIGEKWGVGQKKFDNGVVLLLSLGSERDPTRYYYIAVGYGLEGAIPDLAAKRIEESVLVPYLRNKQYFTALDKTTDVLMGLAKGEINSKEFMSQGNDATNWVALLMVLGFVALIIFVAFKNNKGGGNRGGGFGGPFFFGGFGGGSSFSGGSGGFGGGFGGFGGGSFGGGGAGGSW